MIILTLEKDLMKAYVEFISQREEIVETKNKLNKAEANYNLNKKNEIQKKHEEIKKTLEQTIKDRDKKLKEMGAKIDQAYSLHNAKVKELDKLNETLYQLKKKYEKIREANNPEYPEKVKIAEKNLEKVRAELDAARNKYEQLKNDNVNTEINYNAKIKSIEEQLNKIKENINLDMKKSDEVNEQNTDLKNSLNVVMEQFKTEYHAVREILNKLFKYIDDLKANNTKTNHDIIKLQNAIEVGKKTIDETNNLTITQNSLKDLITKVNNQNEINNKKIQELKVLHKLAEKNIINEKKYKAFATKISIKLEREFYEIFNKTDEEDLKNKGILETSNNITERNILNVVSDSDKGSSILTHVIIENKSKINISDVYSGVKDSNGMTSDVDTNSSNIIPGDINHFGARYSDGHLGYMNLGTITTGGDDNLGTIKTGDDEKLSKFTKKPDIQFYSYNLDYDSNGLNSSTSSQDDSSETSDFNSSTTNTNLMFTSDDEASLKAEIAERQTYFDKTGTSAIISDDHDKISNLNSQIDEALADDNVANFNDKVKDILETIKKEFPVFYTMITNEHA